jgi:hypothetical protein
MSRPEIEQDERFSGLIRELRAHVPEPSLGLQARIERVAEQPARKPQPRPALSRQLPIVGRRRVFFALAAVLVAAVLAGGIVLGSRGSGRTATPVAQTPLQAEASRNAQTFSSADGQAPAGAVPTAPGATTAAGAGRQPASPVTGANRLAELRAELTLRVRSQRELANATGRAERIVRGSGGYVASARYDSGTKSGSSFLELKVPAKRAQSVLARLSALGELLGQNVSLEDLKATVDSQSAAIRSLQAQIAKLVQTLKDPTLSSRAREQLRVQLALDQSRLKGLAAARKATRARGVYATITLTLTTERAQVVHSPGRIHQAFDDARDGLSRELAWVVRATVVGAPVIVLVVLLLLATRQRRRRLEQRLLARS